jgi:hypothetical protein
MASLKIPRKNQRCAQIDDFMTVHVTKREIVVAEARKFRGSAGRIASVTLASFKSGMK